MKLRLHHEYGAKRRQPEGAQLHPTQRLTEEDRRQHCHHHWIRVEQESRGGRRNVVQRVEIAGRLGNVTGATHDDQPGQVSSRGQTLTHHHCCRPEEQGREPEAVAQKLWSREPDPIRELPEDAEGAEADG